MSRRYTAIDQMEKEAKQLQLFSVGDRRCAVFAEEVMAITEWRQPAILPHAPPAILGVVSVHGRMMTVLDPAKLMDGDESENSTHLLALRGDEQLALAISEPGRVIELRESDQKTTTPAGLVANAIEYNGIEVAILDVRELFPTAIRGRERRRRRFE